MDPLKPEIQFTSYRKENTTHLHYKDQFVNAVYSENHMTPINTLCGQNGEFLNVEAGDTHVV
jgi:hypothetical protein